MSELTDKPVDNVVKFDSCKTIPCPYCGTERQIPQNTVEHLIVTLDSQNRINVHGCIHNAEVVSRMIAAIVRATIDENVKLVNNATVTA